MDQNNFKSSEKNEPKRRRLFDLIDNVHRKNRDVPPERTDAAINQAIDEVRRPKRGRGKRSLSE